MQKRGFYSSKFKKRKPSTKGFFKYSTIEPQVKNSDLYAQLKHFRLPIILTIITMLVGTLGYVADGFSLGNAFYQAGITFTTVGFAEIAPISAMGRIFTIFLIISGFAVFSLSIGIMIAQINKGEIARLIKEKRMLNQIARLQNHFVVCYHNKNTIELSRFLRSNHIPFVVVDPNENIEEMAIKYKYPHFIKGEPHTNLSFLKANLSGAKGLIALSENIADNIALVVSARLFESELKISHDYDIIAICKEQEDIERLKKLGATSVISPTNLMAKRVTAIAFNSEMENLLEEFLYKTDTPLDMEEIQVSRTSWMVLKTIGQTHIKEMLNISLIGIRDEDGDFTPMPKDNVVITNNARLLVISTSRLLKKTKEIIQQKETPKEFSLLNANINNS